MSSIGISYGHGAMVGYSGALSKIERAEVHRADLERDIVAFLDRKPYRLIKKMDFETEQFGYDLTLTESVPAAISLIMGDAVHNLRTALDHLICATVAHQGKTIRDTTFPFAHTKADFETALQRKARKATAAVKNLCRNIAPYPGGDELLVALHELDLIDKHQLLLVVAAAGEFRRRYLGDAGKPEKVIAEQVYFLGAETQFIPSAQGYEGDIPFEIRIAVDVVLPADGPMGGQQCAQVLAALASRVREVADMFAALRL